MTNEEFTVIVKSLKVSRTPRLDLTPNLVIGSRRLREGLLFSGSGRVVEVRKLLTAVI